MRRALATSVVLLLFACGEDPVLTPSVPTNITRVGNEVGTPGWMLSEGLSVEVRDERGTPLEGVTVDWSSAETQAWLGATSSVTDANGVATVAFAPGWRVGEQKVRATIGSLHEDVAVEVSTLDLAQVAISPNHHACGLDRAGSLWCWMNWGITSRSGSPRTLQAGARPVLVDAGVKYQEVLVIGLPGGLAEHCGVTPTMRMRCWSFNEDGQTLVRDVDTPVPLVSLVNDSYNTSTCGLDTSGQAWCRGANTHGQLGDGSITERAEFAPVAGAQRFKELASQGSAFCAVDLDDLVWCWGDVGPQPTVLIPTRMAGSTQMREIAFAYGSPCGVGLLDQRLYCWWGGLISGVPDAGTEAGLVPVRPGVMEISGSGGFAVFRWTDGRLAFAGDMAHDVGVNRFVTVPSELTSPPYSLPSIPGGFTSLLSRGGEVWCAAHQEGAVLCGYHADRLVGVAAPQ